MDKITQIPSSKTAKNSVNSIDNIYTITGTLIHKYYENYY